MLNLAQNYMNETKNDIKYKNDMINTETIYLNKFQINKIIFTNKNTNTVMIKIDPLFFRDI